MSRTKELSLAPATSEPLLIQDEFNTTASSYQLHTYTVTLSVNFGFMTGLADTVVGTMVLRIISVLIATGGFVASLAVIVLSPLFPSLVSPVPPQVSSPLGKPLATSSPHPRHSRHLRRRQASPATITVSVRRDPSVLPIIERPERDGTSSRLPLPVRRVSFSPQSSNTSVVDPPSQPGSSNGHAAVHRVLETEGEPAYILPTPPASIASVSSEGDDTETVGMEEFGNASLSLGKRGRRTFPFAKRSKKEAVRADTREADTSSGLFRNLKRAQSLGFAVEVGADPLLRSAAASRKRNSLFSCAHGSRESSLLGSDDVLRESEGETDRASRTSTIEKEARRRSGVSFQDFKAAFGKRERRASALVSASGAYALASPSSLSDRAELDVTAPRTPMSPGDGVAVGVGIGLGRPSTDTARVSPRSVSEGSARTRRAGSPPLRLDTTVLTTDDERREVQSPLTGRPQPSKPNKPLFGGEIVIRNESGRRRTRSSAIPGLYADAEVVRRW